MADDELYFATVTELAKLLRAKKVSSVELTRLFLARLEKFGPHYNALAELTRDLVRNGDGPGPERGRTRASSTIAPR